MKNHQKLVLNLLATLVFSSLTQAQSSESVPVFQITPVVSKITFYVKSSVKLEGTFDKWDATLVFTSTDASTGVLDIKIQADSVNTGSKSKDSKLKAENCFDVEKAPYITFHSTKITQTSSNTFDVAGAFTLRGISKPEALTFTVDRDAGGATGEIKGILTIDRRDFGLGGGIKFVKIADRVDVTIDFKAKRVGPPLVFKDYRSRQIVSMTLEWMFFWSRFWIAFRVRTLPWLGFDRVRPNRWVLPGKHPRIKALDGVASTV